MTNIYTINTRNMFLLFLQLKENNRNQATMQSVWVVLKLATIKLQSYTVNSIHNPRAVLIGIIEITLRECRLGGYKLSDYHSHSVHHHFIGLNRNYATRVSVKLILLSLLITLADYNITNQRKEVCISMCARTKWHTRSFLSVYTYEKRRVY